MVKHGLVAVMAAMFLAGCSDAPAPDMPEPPVAAATELDAASSALVDEVVASCPGLANNMGDWTVGKVEPAGENRRVTIEMADTLRGLPFDTYATGHTCTFEFDEDSPNSIGVMKRPCVAACYGKASDVPTSTYIRIR